jgi:hypothetical protein
MKTQLISESVLNFKPKCESKWEPLPLSYCQESAWLSTCIEDWKLSAGEQKDLHPYACSSINGYILFNPSVSAFTHLHSVRVRFNSLRQAVKLEHVS